jgi:hypothetical protein
MYVVGMDKSCMALGVFLSGAHPVGPWEAIGTTPIESRRGNPKALSSTRVLGLVGLLPPNC